MVYQAADAIVCPDCSGFGVLPTAPTRARRQTRTELTGTDDQSSGTEPRPDRRRRATQTCPAWSQRYGRAIFAVNGHTRPNRPRSRRSPRTLCPGLLVAAPTLLTVACDGVVVGAAHRAVGASAVAGCVNKGPIAGTASASSKSGSTGEAHDVGDSGDGDGADVGVGVGVAVVQVGVTVMQGDVGLAEGVGQELVDPLAAQFQILRTEAGSESSTPCPGPPRLCGRQRALHYPVRGQDGFQLSRCQRSRHIDQVGGQLRALAPVMVELHKTIAPLLRRLLSGICLNSIRCSPGHPAWFVHVSTENEV